VSEATLVSLDVESLEPAEPSVVEVLEPSVVAFDALFPDAPPLPEVDPDSLGMVGVVGPPSVAASAAGVTSVVWEQPNASSARDAAAIVARKFTRPTLIVHNTPNAACRSVGRCGARCPDRRRGGVTQPGSTMSTPS
jgi:hypothetical protein